MHFEGAHIRMYFLLFRSRLAYNVKVLYVKGLYVKAIVYGIPSLDLICKCMCGCECEWRCRLGFTGLGFDLRGTSLVTPAHLQ